VIISTGRYESLAAGASAAAGEHLNALAQLRQQLFMLIQQSGVFDGQRQVPRGARQKPRARRQSVIGERQPKQFGQSLASLRLARSKSKPGRGSRSQQIHGFAMNNV